MAGEFHPHSEMQIPQTVAALYMGFPVNNMNYNRLKGDKHLEDETDIVQTHDADIGNGSTSTMLLYYPSSKFDNKPFTAYIPLQEGRELRHDFIHEVVQSPFEEAIREQFILANRPQPFSRAVTAAIFDFARDAHQVGVPLIEQRNELLKKKHAPLAAFVLKVTGNVCSFALLTPEIVWPMAAVRELQQAIEQDL